jgi:hypothetical protein
MMKNARYLLALIVATVVLHIVSLFLPGTWPNIVTFISILASVIALLWSVKFGLRRKMAFPLRLSTVVVSIFIAITLVAMTFGLLDALAANAAGGIILGPSIGAFLWNILHVVLLIGLGVLLYSLTHQEEIEDKES